MKKLKILINFILIIYKIIPIINIIVFPFVIKKKAKKSEKDETEFYIYTKIEIGEPPQELNCEINFDTSFYFMTNSPYNVVPTYNASLSKSLVNNYKKSNDGFYAYENFYFCGDLQCNKKELVESLIVPYAPREDKLAALEIGFQSRHLDSRYQNFIHNLNNKIINNYIWTIKFTNINEGLIVIGGYPHEYEKDNYKENDLILSNTFSENDKIYWGLKFKYYPISNNYTLSQNIKAIISPEIIGIIASYDYLTTIEQNFFNNFYNKNICRKIIVSFEKTNYYKITCSKGDFTPDDINKFPSLQLYNLAFNQIFIFHGKEMFREEEEGIVFNALAEIDSSKTEWKIGRILLLKYQFIFDDDNILIGYYNKKENKEIKNKKLNLVVKYLILFFCIIMFIFLSFVLYKKLNILVKRKKLANELEDDFMYIAGRSDKK